MEITQFDDIRPYNAEEIPAAMERIANSSSFPLLASYVYPDEPLEEEQSEELPFDEEDATDEVKDDVGNRPIERVSRAK